MCVLTTMRLGGAEGSRGGAGSIRKERELDLGIGSWASSPREEPSDKRYPGMPRRSRRRTTGSWGCLALAVPCGFHPGALPPGRRKQPLRVSLLLSLLYFVFYFFCPGSLSSEDSTPSSDPGQRVLPVPLTGSWRTSLHPEDAEGHPLPSWRGVPGREAWGW